MVWIRTYKSCKNCGKQFLVKGVKQKFCSARCRYAYHYESKPRKPKEDWSLDYKQLCREAKEIIRSHSSENRTKG